jgi:hypothetical protein
MTANITEDQLSKIDPSQRVLLLPHCLRHSQTCQGKYNEQGLDCQDCTADCSVSRLRRAALKLGYGGVCIAPGGRLAVNYVKRNNPRGIVAVACQKELEEGIECLNDLLRDEGLMPPIVIVPLERDGCVDTEVDEKYALKKIALGCFLELAKGEV